MNNSLIVLPEHKEEEEEVSFAKWDNHLTPTPGRRQRRRRQSDESHESECSSKAASIGCSDSGHFSSANVSDCCLLLTDEQTRDAEVQDALRQKDQALFLALQDVRRLRSELERLSKSEKWYKQELRTQKHSRLEALEKLYTNERKYMQENQRLQRECLRLYAKCGEVERDLEEKRAKALQDMQREQQQHDKEHLKKQTPGSNEHAFEMEQQTALIDDQQKLIEVLRKQKSALLQDLKRLSAEKDSKIFELQRSLADLEADNQRITKKCKTMIDERRALELDLSKKTAALESTNEEQQQLETKTKETQAELNLHKQQLTLKDKEIQELQRNFKHTLRHELEADEIHRLSVDFHHKITQKTTEIAMLKRSLNALQQELAAVEDLQVQHEQQHREIEQMRSALEEKSFELTKLQECDVKRSAEITNLKAEIEEYQGITRAMEQSQELKQHHLEELMQSREAFKRIEQELIAANQRYASMCALCEQTRFDLDMREIELGKLQYEKRKEVEEVQELRKKLVRYLQQTEELSAKINELEMQLKCRRLQKQSQDGKKEKISKEDNEQVNETIYILEKEKTRRLEKHSQEETKERRSNKFIEINSGAEKTIISKMEHGEHYVGFTSNEEFKRYDKNIENSLEDFEFGSESVITNDSINRNILENSSMHYDADFKELDMKLQEMSKYIEELETENMSLKLCIKERIVGADVQEHRSDKHREYENKQSTQESYCDTIPRGVKSNNEDFEKLHEKLLELNNYIEKLEENNKELKDLIKERIGMEHIIELEKVVETAVKTEEVSCEGQHSKLHQRYAPVTLVNFEDNETLSQLHELHCPVAVIKPNVEDFERHHFELKESHSLDTEIKVDDVDFEEVHLKLQEMHAFLQQLQEENEKLKELVEERTDFSAALQERQADFKMLQTENQILKSALKTLQSKQQTSIATQVDDEENMRTKLQENGATLECLVNESHALKTQMIEILNLKAQITEAYDRAKAELERTKETKNVLQLKLLKNDAKLYKLERTNQRVEIKAIDERELFAVEEKNKRLQTELKTMQEKHQLLEKELRENKANLQENKNNCKFLKLQDENKNLRQKLQELEQTVYKVDISRELGMQETAKLSAANVFKPKNDEAEFLSLREKVTNLEQQLKQALSTDNQQREQRIALISKLLEQQNQKVAQLNATQADWEELLQALNATQALEEATRAELQQKHAQLEELNELFENQNLELQRLHKLSVKQEKRRQIEQHAMQQTFQQQLTALQLQVKQSDTEKAQQAKLIEDLQLKNRRLSKDYDEDYAREAAENKKELRHMRKSMDKLSKERLEITIRMEDMEQELVELRRNKRQAVFMPPQICLADSYDDNESVQVLDSSDNSCNKDSHGEEYMRILTKVLENEYKRKMLRYDLHIRSLLNNVRGLKSALSSEAQKVSSLQELQMEQSQQLQELQLTKQQLLETRQRFENSQKTIKILEQQLLMSHKQYDTTDSGKSPANEAVHEVANLIDDYKKLIQQSAANTKRPKTSAILNLLERSNQCVPNFNKLETSVQDLRNDIQHFIVSQSAQRLGNPFAQAHKKPSLLDELQAAVQHA